MPQSLSQILVHIVFSTHDRIPYFEDRRLRSAVHSYLAKASDCLGCPAIEVGGVADHVHIAASLSRTMTAADLVRRLKKESSKWIKREFPGVESFFWQKGYGAFSVSPGHLDALRRYIRDQEARHRNRSFQDEFVDLLRRYAIDHDEYELWA